EGYLARLANAGGALTRVRLPKNRTRWNDGWGSKDFAQSGLFALPGPHRLALEMALHEEAERRAIEGELAELERAWREAEEIAGIADSLLVPEGVDASMEKMRRQVGGET